MEKNNTAAEQQLKVVAAPQAQPAVKFFRIPDLQKYQHYKQRSPPWVKLHAEQLEDYYFQQMPDAMKFHALALVYLAAKTNNKIANDPAWVAMRIGARDPVDLVGLWEAGFLEPWQPRLQEPGPGEQLDLPETPAPTANLSTWAGSTDASNLLAKRLQVASTETETETQTEAEPEAHTEADTAPAGAGRPCGCCGASVCSEFSYGDALELVKRWKREGRLVGGKAIKNPGGLARTLHREGTADDEIRLLLRPPPRREFTDEPCPTCFGSKFETVPGKGARDCTACVDELGRRTGRRAKDAGGPAGRSP